MSILCGSEKIQWVQCEDCQKWRKLPASALLPSRWTCSDNQWDPDRYRRYYVSFYWHFWALVLSFVLCCKFAPDKIGQHFQMNNNAFHSGHLCWLLFCKV